jgi:hypothetical protein
MKMADTLRQSADLEAVEPSISGLSWAAVSAGAAASLAITLVLLSFGAGMGFAVVSPWGGSGVSATTFKIGTGLFFIVMAMLSSSIGGYLAGRLRTKWVGIHTTEVQFRIPRTVSWHGRSPQCWGQSFGIAREFDHWRFGWRRNPSGRGVGGLWSCGGLCRHVATPR